MSSFLYGTNTDTATPAVSVSFRYTKIRNLNYNTVEVHRCTTVLVLLITLLQAKMK